MTGPGEPSAPAGPESKSAAFRHSQLNHTLRVLTLHRNAQDERDGVTPALSSNYLTFSIPEKYPHNRWVEIEVSTNDLAIVSADTNDRNAAASFA